MQPNLGTRGLKASGSVSCDRIPGDFAFESMFRNVLNLCILEPGKVSSFGLPEVKLGLS